MALRQGIGGFNGRSILFQLLRKHRKFANQGLRKRARTGPGLFARCLPEYYAVKEPGSEAQRHGVLGGARWQRAGRRAGRRVIWNSNLMPVVSLPHQSSQYALA